MKTLVDRFYELLKANQVLLQSFVIINDIIKIIKKEYFNDELDIKLKIDSLKNYSFKFYINDDVYDDIIKFVFKLEYLYELRQLKHKINRINEIN